MKFSSDTYKKLTGLVKFSSDTNEKLIGLVREESASLPGYKDHALKMNMSRLVTKPTN